MSASEAAQLPCSCCCSQPAGHCGVRLLSLGGPSSGTATLLGPSLRTSLLVHRVQRVT